MITARSPLRISLGGGGTDLASYYEENEGFVISAAIDKYIYVNVMRPFKKGIYLKYSKTEYVEKVSQVEHPIIREVLNTLNLKTPQIEIVTSADIPSGTGLGSSGSFSTALIKALYTHRKRHIHQEDIARLACKVEIEILKEPIGKQDQYAASTGGLTSFTFHKNGNVSAKPLNLNMETIFKLEDNLLLFFTGYSRKAGNILKEQKIKSESKDRDMINNLHYVKKIGFQVRDALENGDVNAFGELMNSHWNYKKKRSNGMTNSNIDQWYDLALKNGAIGGKLVGAGGGGFLMFVAKDRDLLRKKMTDIGLEEVRFKFDFEGTKVVLTS
jgi:D-glycero-alpha-D-manno-heptose-7-phosphate kinase